MTLQAYSNSAWSFCNWVSLFTRLFRPSFCRGSRQFYFLHLSFHYSNYSNEIFSGPLSCTCTSKQTVQKIFSQCMQQHGGQTLLDSTATSRKSSWDKQKKITSFFLQDKRRRHCCQNCKLYQTTSFLQLIKNVTFLLVLDKIFFGLVGLLNKQWKQKTRKKSVF